MARSGIALTVILSAVVAACGGNAVTSRPSPAASAANATAVATTPPSASPTVEPSDAPPSESAAPSIDDAGATRALVSGSPDWVIVVDGLPFTAAQGGILALDPNTGEPGEVTLVDGAICSAFDAGSGGIWAETCDTNTLVRLDPETRKITAKVTLPGDVQWESSVGVGEGGIWTANMAGELVKVDAKTLEVDGTWKVVPLAGGVRAGLGSVWVASPDQDKLVQVDPDDPTTSKTIVVGAMPRFLAIGEGAVWVLNQTDGTVTRVGADGTVEATVPVTDGRVEGGDIAVGGGLVWARTSQELVVAIDPSTNEIVARFGPMAGSGSVAADATAVWVSAHDVSTIWRLPLPLAGAGS